MVLEQPSESMMAVIYMNMLLERLDGKDPPLHCQETSTWYEPKPKITWTGESNIFRLSNISLVPALIFLSAMETLKAVVYFFV